MQESAAKTASLPIRKSAAKTESSIHIYIYIYIYIYIFSWVFTWWQLEQMCRPYCNGDQFGWGSLPNALISPDAQSLRYWCLEAMPLLGIVVGLLLLGSLGLAFAAVLEQAAVGVYCWHSAPRLTCCCSVPSAGLEGVLLLVFGSPSCCFHCMLVCFALWLWCMFKGACSLWL
jgi:hypothetical protein